MLKKSLASVGQERTVNGRGHVIVRFGPVQLNHIESRAFPQIPGKERPVEYVNHGRRFSRWSVPLYEDT
jgi:hypothetical protein